MITDQETNYLFLADTLPVKYPKFSAAFINALAAANVPYSFIPDTKDIWARDYMPIQISMSKFIRFLYRPDYLIQSPKWSKTISDTDSICRKMGIETLKSEIILDGGNVVRSKTKVIMSTKVFRENPTISEKQLKIQLENLFEVDRIVFIPQDPYDEIGHADGMVRFLNDNVVFVNDYAKENIDFQCEIHSALINAGLQYIKIPFNPYQNMRDWDATGIYVNYLQVGGVIFIPIYNRVEDEQVIRMFGDLLPEIRILPVSSNQIAKEGGVLNCISWNITNG